MSDNDSARFSNCTPADTRIVRFKIPRCMPVLQFDLHLDQGVFCATRSNGEAALDPIARGDRMRNAVHHG
jgi:hypothetical protein